MNQTAPASEAVLRLHDGRRADSFRVLRKFALSAAIQVAEPGTEPEKIVRAAKLFTDFLEGSS